MRAQKAIRHVLKHLLMVPCWTVIVLVHLSCSSTAIEQNNAALAEFNDNQTVITILDISDVHNPQMLSSIDLPFLSNVTNNVIVSEGYGYATTGQGLHIINLSPHRKPEIAASVALPGEINEVRLFRDYLYIGSNQGLHIVDISKPHKPVIMRTGGPEEYENMPVRGIELHASYAYVMDAYNYLHVLDLSVAADPRLIESIPVSDRWLLAVRAGGPKAQLIQLPHSPSFCHGIVDELLNRKNLLQFNGWFDKVRVSDDHLVFVDSRTWQNIVLARGSALPMLGAGDFQNFYLNANYLAHLYLSGKRKVDSRTPTHAAVLPQSIHLTAQDEWSQTVRVPDKLLGHITDIQLSGDVLCVTSSHGVFLIADVTKNETPKILSAINFLSHQPTSFAIDEGYACVMRMARS